MQSNLAEVNRIVFALLMLSFYPGLIEPKVSDRRGRRGLPGNRVKGPMWQLIYIYTVLFEHQNNEINSLYMTIDSSEVVWQYNKGFASVCFWEYEFLCLVTV